MDMNDERIFLNSGRISIGCSLCEDATLLLRLLLKVAGRRVALASLESDWSLL
jgi:hypothetical protein